MAKVIKSAELIFRRLLNWLLSGNYTPKLVNKPEPLFTFKNTKKILLLRHDRIGDILISTPFLSILRTLLPNTRIDIILSFRNQTAANIVEQFADNILIYPKSAIGIIKLIRLVRKTKYDIIIDLLDNESTTSNLLLKFSKIKHKLSFNKNNMSNYSVTVPMPDKNKIHPANRLLSLLYPFDYQATNNIKLEIPISKTIEQKASELLGNKNKTYRLGLNLSGSTLDKYWGKHNFICLINMISETHPEFEIVIFSTKNLKDEAEAIALATNSHKAPNIHDFMLYAAMLKKCNLIITPDTSAVHIASAFQIPVIALYVHHQNASDMPWTPINTKYKALIANNNIMQISVTEVYNAFSEILSEFEL